MAKKSARSFLLAQAIRSPIEQAFLSGQPLGAFSLPHQEDDSKIKKEDHF